MCQALSKDLQPPLIVVRSWFPRRNRENQSPFSPRTHTRNSLFLIRLIYSIPLISSHPPAMRTVLRSIVGQSLPSRPRTNFLIATGSFSRCFRASISVMGVHCLVTVCLFDDGSSPARSVYRHPVNRFFGEMLFAEGTLLAHVPTRLALSVQQDRPKMRSV